MISIARAFARLKRNSLIQHFFTIPAKYYYTQSTCSKQKFTQKFSPANCFFPIQVSAKLYIPKFDIPWSKFVPKLFQENFLSPKFCSLSPLLIRIQQTITTAISSNRIFLHGFTKFISSFLDVSNSYYVKIILQKFPWPLVKKFPWPFTKYLILATQFLNQNPALVEISICACAICIIRGFTRAANNCTTFGPQSCDTRETSSQQRTDPSNPTQKFLLSSCTDESLEVSLETSGHKISEKRFTRSLLKTRVLFALVVLSVYLSTSRSSGNVPTTLLSSTSVSKNALSAPIGGSFAYLNPAVAVSFTVFNGLKDVRFFTGTFISPAVSSASHVVNKISFSKADFCASVVAQMFGILLAFVLKKAFCLVRFTKIWKSNTFMEISNLESTTQLLGLHGKWDWVFSFVNGPPTALMTLRPLTRLTHLGLNFGAQPSAGIYIK